MEQIILSLLEQLISLFIVVGLGLLSAYLHKKLGIEKLKEVKSTIENKQQIVDLAVLFAQEAFKNLEGEDKFREVYVYASKKFKELGLNISGNELEVLIDSSVKRFRKEFGKSWKEI